MIIRSSTTPGQINFHADEVKYCTKSSKVQASGKKFMFEKKKKKFIHCQTLWSSQL